MITFTNTPSHLIVDTLVEKSKNPKSNVTNQSTKLDLVPGLENDLRLEDVFQKRTSTRFFKADPVKYSDLLKLLQQNTSFMKSISEPELFQQLVILRNIDNPALSLESVYQYDLETNRIIPRFQFSEEKVHEFYLQKEFAFAPVTIVLVGKLEESIKKNHGLSGYKDLLQKSGSIAHYAWLNALSMGYAGTVFAGFNPNSLYQLCNIDGYRDSQMIAFSFGYSH
ncbi:nitroreductase family protein [Alkalihalobacillus sp. R86527]|uniref:nitroreductase family protein n=1 Tax=Alkalihalobacillus sp. R86527 TaxID=3093863 RepID=UPI003671CB26